MTRRGQKERMVRAKAFVIKISRFNTYGPIGFVRAAAVSATLSSSHATPDLVDVLKAIVRDELKRTPANDDHGDNDMDRNCYIADVIAETMGG